MKRFSIIFLLCALSVAACKRVELPMQVLELSTDNIVAPVFGADYSLTVQTNTSWKVVADAVPWVNTDIEKGVGTAEITVSVVSNDREERSGSLVFESLDGKVRREIAISQCGESSDVLPIRLARKFEREGGFTFPTGVIRGFVVATPMGGNYKDGSLAIVDDFKQACSGITLVGEIDEEMTCGREVELDLSGRRLTRDSDGCLVIDAGDAIRLTEMTQITVNPLEIPYSDIAGGDYESMLVSLNRYQPLEEYVGCMFSTNPLIENKDGQKARVMVQKTASFASKTFKSGAGPLAGVICGVSEGYPAIYPQSEKAVEFGKFRFGVLPGIKKLPYVFSLYCASQTNGDTKYVDYTQLIWQPTTKMFSGVIAKDKDATAGGSLEMAAFASDISKTLSGKGVTNMWAEAGGHDNINCAGFVSPDGKTTPTSECGWWLTVPLQMDMPTSFNVFFGLCVNEWSISTWVLSYSYDKIDWIPAGNVKVNRWTSGGSYYYRFCVPVTTSRPFTSDSNLYLKITPFGTSAGNPANDGVADGHGSSTFIRLHSAIIVADSKVPATAVPAGAVYFEPFDNLNEGTDFFVGDRLAGMANFCGSDIASWSTLQVNGLSGSNVRQRPGYAQIGYANDEDTGSRSKMENKVGSLTTPELGKAGDFSLSFKAAAYKSPAIRTGAQMSSPDVISPDIDEAVLEISGGGTINGSTTVAITSLPTDCSMKEYSFKIVGATASTKLTFTSNVAADGFSRWFIDDILIK